MVHKKRLFGVGLDRRNPSAGSLVWWMLLAEKSGNCMRLTSIPPPPEIPGADRSCRADWVWAAL
jgi:hypothetical protein